MVDEGISAKLDESADLARLKFLMELMKRYFVTGLSDSHGINLTMHHCCKCTPKIEAEDELLPDYMRIKDDPGGIL